jgi:hypothetical protein
MVAQQVPKLVDPCGIRLQTMQRYERARGDLICDGRHGAAIVHGSVLIYQSLIIVRKCVTTRLC